ncbi:MAG: 3-isopropylmalate dehydrogenase [Sandaracinus sp.]|nr:3-isopropylmalate dehydrogenase [Sandaracinus sp.]MCB9634216.1 3-isopropylmalate dehydrogenase [Sandaracinus sp.]
MRQRIVLLPGDGIGVEIVAATRTVLDALAASHGLDFEFEERLIGGAAIDAMGDPLPEESLDACRGADAILLGAVGGPKWDDPKAKVRPEQGLLRIRKALGLYANLRPVKAWPALLEASPLKRDRIENVDLLFVRELTGGIYFGEPREEGSERALDTMVYTRPEVERVVDLAFRLASERKKKVTSIDKANVLASMRLWRQVAVDVGARHPEVKLEHQLVDSMAMRLVTDPASFDVIVAGNMFGDILSDEGAVLTGTLGLLPSASLGDPGQAGLYEPIHGSAPDIAGKGVANPVATVLSAAMMLRLSLGRAEAADALEAAVERALKDTRTRDLGGKASTTEMADAIIAAIEA